MLATIERLEILDETKELANMVLQSEEAEEYRRFYYKLKNNTQSQIRISKFVKLKEQYEDVQRFGRYHPDYSLINKEVREAKREMDLDENVAGFRRAETALQSMLDEISRIVGQAVSEQIKVPSGNPFFETGSSCSGGCGSGGGCSCSA
ncbi:YlbF family regulator [Heyndrickxia acidicola]|uniref:YlbF family regulator n=1 Tax=Heyndrickxia acidicola TaxID=209389 RepID=A0ABU6MCR2_9BACI|nr:YlbF family regulator [Heyndrickxia acidicola]MED1202192.1 YlbF family regulator [Heyndrickxia acidicola]